ncbi:SDR family oxidoreductase [Chelativorans sp. Marseille-P2723]|uniref:SDR family oxidoreductase n=1 Tax=Chelativorans sp. Marseille-P2723 TaxID=2709133 RepID=UPI0015706C6E|nr:SDR family oxidoreductase [Chelativorans sp. Marseille-P2723]
MDLGISGKLAVVTGGSRNVGRAAAEALARDGCQVVVVSRGLKDANEVVEAMAAEGHRVSAIQGDVSRHENIAPLFDRIRKEHGNPDILVYSNGGPPDSLADQANVVDYLAGYDMAVLSFLKAVEEVAGHMKEKGWGRIVTLGSMCAKHPHKEVPMIVHNIVRPAALGAARTLANELGRYGITINTIGTGRIDSGESGSFRRTYRAIAAERGIPAEDLMAKMLKGIPVARAGLPEEAGALCAFLCSVPAGFITGQLIMCDGGQNNVLY